MNKFKKFFYNIKRIYAKKYLTGNLGKVVEDDDKITCYVKRNKIKLICSHYAINCIGIGEKQKNVAKEYKLNKSICYVIEDIELKNFKAYIYGDNNCEIIIKNCNFGLDLYIHVNGKCTLDNTNITTLSRLLIGANDLVIKNMNNDQIKVIGSKSNICFGADNRIDVIDSTIGSHKKDISVSFIATNELNVVNSKIVGKEVECKSSTINVDKRSSLIANDKVNLQADDFNSININAPAIILNGEEIENAKKSVVLTRMTEPLVLKRLELVNLLKKIKIQCEKINAEKVLEYQEELNVQSIGKILKK